MKTGVTYTQYFNLANEANKLPIGVELIPSLENSSIYLHKLHIESCNQVSDRLGILIFKVEDFNSKVDIVDSTILLNSNIYYSDLDCNEMNGVLNHYKNSRLKIYSGVIDNRILRLDITVEWEYKNYIPTPAPIGIGFMMIGSTFIIH